MLPWIIAAAASLLSQKQQERKQQEALLMDQYRKNAQEAGANTRMADVLGAQAQINDGAGAQYGNALLSLIGKADAGDDDELGYNEYTRPGKSSGVRMKKSDFY